jgi:cobalt-zinc-cadmium efflux system membrane fusion protein
MKRSNKMNPLQKILLILKTIAPVILLLWGTSCSNPDNQNNPSPPNQGAEEHIHAEHEAHDDHDHDLHNHDEATHKEEHADEHLHGEDESHDDHDHTLHDESEHEKEHADEHLHAEDEVHDNHDHEAHDESEHNEVHPDEPVELDLHTDDHSEEGLVHLSKAERKNLGIEIVRAKPGTLKIQLSFPGEIRLNADRQANIVPRLSGIVKEVMKSVGDPVTKGEVMAVIESRDLADARSFFHAARERVTLAKANFAREERLWKKKISAEQEYLIAKQELSEARIELESAKQKLLALGFSSKYLEEHPHDLSEVLTEFNVTAPFEGKIIEKDITLGELLQEDTVAFIIADLSTVWVDLSIYQKDLPFVREGQSVSISSGRGIPDVEGTISYLSPVITEETRTALARVILPNPEGYFRPGLFITANLIGEEIPVSLQVKKSALQNLEGETCVFIKHLDGFKSQPVTVGRTSKTHAEITSGLKQGQYYVVNGAFEIKAKIITSTMDSHAGHGH